MSASKFSKFLQEEPLGLAASYAFVFHSIAFFFISLPLSPSINSLTSFPTWSLFTSPFISTPIPHLLQANQQLVCCYEKNGLQINGTLQLTLQVSNCQILLLLGALKSDPVDTNLLACLYPLFLQGIQEEKCSTHHHQCQRAFSLLARTQANSSIFCGVRTAMLPKFIYTTKSDSFESSHSVKSDCSFHRFEPILFCLSSAIWLSAIKWRGSIA